jgi:hypothetical protein
MVYLLKMVIFHGYVSHNQRVLFVLTFWLVSDTKSSSIAGAYTGAYYNIIVKNQYSDTKKHLLCNPTVLIG